MGHIPTLPESLSTCPQGRKQHRIYILFLFPWKSVPMQIKSLIQQAVSTLTLMNSPFFLDAPHYLVLLLLQFKNH